MSDNNIVDDTAREEFRVWFVDYKPVNSLCYYTLLDMENAYHEAQTALLARVRELEELVQNQQDNIMNMYTVVVDPLRADLKMALSCLMFVDTRCTPEAQISVSRTLYHLAKYGDDK